MANPERGEVDLTTSEKTYTLAMSVNAICVIQRRTGKTYKEICHAMGELDIAAMRDIVWMSLQLHHAKQFPNSELAGDLIDRLPNGTNDAVKAINELFALSAKRGGTNGNGASDAVDPPPAQS